MTYQLSTNAQDEIWKVTKNQWVASKPLGEISRLSRLVLHTQHISGTFVAHWNSFWYNEIKPNKYSYICLFNIWVFFYVSNDYSRLIWGKAMIGTSEILLPDKIQDAQLNSNLNLTICLFCFCFCLLLNLTTLLRNSNNRLTQFPHFRMENLWSWWWNKISSI